MIEALPPRRRRLAVVAALAAWLGFAAVPLAANPLPVIAVPVVEDDFVDPVEALGTLRANESARLSSSITEIISEVRFDDGERVSAGQILVVMTNREQLAQLEEAEAEVEEAERQYERVKSLAERNQASQAELDQRRRAIDTARARLRAVEARLSDRLVVAPFDGVVGLRNVSAGSLLSPGDIVATLHDDSVMKLDFAIPETLLRLVSPGAAIIAHTRAYPDEAFGGEIVTVDNEVDAVTRAIQVRALVPNPDGRLRPGMLMTLTLGANARTTLVIPEEALLPQGRRNYVFVAREDDDGYRAERRAVRTGSRRPGEVEIIEGLSAGELVVTHGGLRLGDGRRLALRNSVERGEGLAELLHEDRARQ